MKLNLLCTSLARYSFFSELILLMLRIFSSKTRKALYTLEHGTASLQNILIYISMDSRIRIHSSSFLTKSGSIMIARNVRRFSFCLALPAVTKSHSDTRLFRMLSAARRDLKHPIKVPQCVGAGCTRALNFAAARAFFSLA